MYLLYELVSLGLKTNQNMVYLRKCYSNKTDNDKYDAYKEISLLV